MSTIVFRTPGTIDVRAFTTMGVNAKLHPGAIGYFGTGLKYAVAVLCRLGASFVVHTGGERYTFETRPMRFRDQEFQQVVMRRDSFLGGEGWRLGRFKKLPYTTQYGRNWQAWMAFRELYSNTLDEAGEVCAIDTWDPDDAIRAATSEFVTNTYIAVSGCEEFHAAYLDRDSIFLDKSAMKVVGGAAGQLEVLEGGSERLYYQGLRAKDLPKPTLFTYNFLTAQELTEDRQLAHEYGVKRLLANAVARSDDEAMIEAIVAADEKHWEHGLEPDSWVSPSPAFHRVMVRRGGRTGYGWGGYYRKYDERPSSARDYWKEAQRPWRVDGGTVVAADDTPLFAKPFDMSDLNWQQLAGRLVKIGNGGMAEEGVALLESAEANAGQAHEPAVRMCAHCDVELTPDHSCWASAAVEEHDVLELLPEDSLSNVKPGDDDDLPF